MVWPLHSWFASPPYRLVVPLPCVRLEGDLMTDFLAWFWWPFRVDNPDLSPNQLKRLKAQDRRNKRWADHARGKLSYSAALAEEE